MADEITLTGKLSVTNGSYKDNIDASRVSVTQSNIGGIHSVQNIGTTYEAIALGDVSTEGFAMFRNLDSTNFVQIGLDAGASLTPVMRLNSGETAGPFRIDAAATLYAEADTAAVELEVVILEA